MSKQIKRVTFANNNYGLAWLDVNTHSWEIVDACGAGRHLIKRACRLADRGMKLEYRNGATYTAINAAVEKMG
ncbi:hypothetical protein ACQKEI_01175 [Psychrobacter namhaensis]|uniref:hypothetical protein n=1 Tax=Psychrobacter namhaensis TaxID=292734 RepID=UPI003D00A6B3